jgi:hypothetical protein
MKRNYTLLLFLLATVSILAQTPEKMSYQLVLRDASNTLLTNQEVGIQISILQTTITGTAVYTEIQTATTNINGLVSLEIGSGTSSDDFSAIDWSGGPYFIKTATDASGGSNYSIVGTSQLMSVPYALYAKTAGNVINNEPDCILSPCEGMSISFGDDTIGEVRGGSFDQFQLSNSSVFLINGLDLRVGTILVAPGFTGAVSPSNTLTPFSTSDVINFTSWNADSFDDQQSVSLSYNIMNPAINSDVTNLDPEGSATLQCGANSILVKCIKPDTSILEITYTGSFDYMEYDGADLLGFDGATFTWRGTFDSNATPSLTNGSNLDRFAGTISLTISGSNGSDGTYSPN